MPESKIIVVGASAGGLAPLKALVQELGADLPAAVFIVWHLAPESPGLLPVMLSRVTPLPVAHPADHEPIQPGRIYVAPPDRHLVIEPRPGGNGSDARIRITRGPKENRARPSVDVLFRSAAAIGGPRVIGVILSGLLDDGAAGIGAIKERGGMAVVQDPLEADYPNMPINAMKAAAVDYCVSVGAMGELLKRLICEPMSNETMNAPPADMLSEVQMAIEAPPHENGSSDWGNPTLFTCPECHGALMERSAPLLRFRCHTGHAFSPESLLADVTRAIDASWAHTLRAIEESAMLMTRLADRLRETGRPEEAETLAEKGREAKRRAELVREALHEHEGLGSSTETPGMVGDRVGP